LSDELTNRPPATTCEYCGCPLDARVYFCPRCAKQHKSVESMLPASLPAYEDTETKLRTKAGPAWTVFFTYLHQVAGRPGAATPRTMNACVFPHQASRTGPGLRRDHHQQRPDHREACNQDGW
jgi:hypothetical protein